MWHPVNSYEKANDKYIKDYDKNKDHHILNTGTSIIYLAGQCHKNCY